MSETCSHPPGVLFWFRHDLRLHDQVALHQAVRRARRCGGWLLPVFVHDAIQDRPTTWGFPRTHPRRLAWRAQALHDLEGQLLALGSTLWQCHGDPAQRLRELVTQLGHPEVVCEDIAAPEEQAVVRTLREAGVSVFTVWQSSLLEPGSLPFAPEAVPDTFTVYRQLIEKASVRAPTPLPVPTHLPPSPPVDWTRSGACTMQADTGSVGAPPVSGPGAATGDGDPRSAFPSHEPEFHGGERAALAHLRRYCERGLPHRYKATRNGLMGVDYSSKWSPWLSTGALSARQAWAAIQSFEHERGASDSTYWLWFELLWRDHFRWLHWKYGTALYGPGGIKGGASPSHDVQAFERWCRGQTGHAFIDAGMRELASTGYLSNRMRQNVASYLIHELQGDWRAGAAWFESQLLDHDVYSNQGNWLYLSGRGTDPRGGRRFNPDKQAGDYDADGAYRRCWADVAR